MRHLPLIVSLTLLLSLTSFPALACDDPAAPCDNDAWSIYLPDHQGDPAPNVTLENFQHMNPAGMSEAGIAHDELMRLNDALRPLAARAFGKSPTAFEVKVRYTLTPGKPAVFEMQTTGGEAEYDMLQQFYDLASKLEGFHSTAPLIYVLFHYSIKPVASPAPPAKADERGGH